MQQSILHSALDVWLTMLYFLIEVEVFYIKHPQSAAANLLSQPCPSWTVNLAILEHWVEHAPVNIM